jgi:hypothetical protein
MNDEDAREWLAHRLLLELTQVQLFGQWYKQTSKQAKKKLCMASICPKIHSEAPFVIGETKTRPNSV